MGVKSYFQEGSRKEILGFMIIVFAVFVFISLASHDKLDIAKFERPVVEGSPEYLISEGDYLNREEVLNEDGTTPPVEYDRSLSFAELLDVHVENQAGLVGAAVSEYVLRILGRSSFILTLVLMVIGWRLLFQYENNWMRNKLLEVFLFVFVIGTIFSLFDLDNPAISSTLTESLAGSIGWTLAKVSRSLFAVAGGFAILGAAAIFLLFTIIPFRPGSIRKGIDTTVAVAGRSSKTAAVHLHQQSQSWWPSLKALFHREPKLEELEREDDKPANPSPAQPEVDFDEQLQKAESKIVKAQRKEPEQLPLSLDDVQEKRGKLRFTSKASRVTKDGYTFPALDIMQVPPSNEPTVSPADLEETAAALLSTLNTFDVEVIPGSLEKYPGPIITRFEFKPAPGIKINQIVNLADDLALALKASRIRIIAPVPGKSAVGVEIPNRKAQKVYIREILQSDAYQRGKYKLPLALGKTTMGQPFVVDLARMPHLLIAGSTGSGKSVCLNTVITSLIYKHTPKTLRFIFIDPKILELSVYGEIPFLARPVVTKPKMAESVLAGAVNEMEERYKRLATQSVRSLDDYNAKVPEADRLPYLLIVVDELADMMMSGSAGKIELLITRLAQMARAVGIHLILATQRPSVDVITGLIKANFSSRIAFQVASKVDSRTILDANGAEKLLGQGDMLLLLAGEPEPLRIHGAYVSSQETESLVGFFKETAPEIQPLQAFSEENEKALVERNNHDVLLPEATELVIRHKQGSVSLLQRRLGIGYQRAARIMDQLEATGIVGPYDGSKAREVLVDKSYLDQMMKKDKPST